MKKKTKTDKTLSPRDRMIQGIRKQLLHQREVLLTEAGIIKNTSTDETLFPELGDQAAAEINRNFMLRLRERERKLLKKIDKALEKMDSGTYGICETCGQEIGVKRLEARPVTTLCIECKTEQEAEEKLREK